MVKIEILNPFLTIVQGCRYNFCGAKIVSNFAKSSYTKRYSNLCEKVYFKPFLMGFINTYGKL